MPLADIIASRYKVVRALGSGGMGVVFLVEDLRQKNRRIALKTLHAAGDPEAIASFRSEFRNLRGVVHPHIPEMFDFGTVAGGPATNGAPVQYFTSEFVEGAPLNTLRELWQPAQLHDVIVALARALSFLHGRSLLHRDIKPENVLARLDQNGHLELLKLVDFGLATKITGGQTPRGDRRHGVSGTIDYLAPEIINGGPATVATDLYAFGMLLYQLAVGRLPFDGQDSIAATKIRTTHEPPPPLRFRPDLPVGLSDVISALLHLKPEDRPNSARHVIRLLNEREGTEYAYASPETQSAYIRSAESISNADARSRLSQLKLTLDSLNPLPVIIRGPHGLGRTRLIRDFASELTLDGFAVRLVTSDDDLDSTDPVRALLVPDENLVTVQWLCRVLDIARQTGVWCVIGQNRHDAMLEEVLGAHECIELAPLSRQGTSEMLRATFPESDIPPEFANELYEWTIGFSSALQATLDQFIREGRLRIGLHGWELQPGARHFQLHKQVAAFLMRKLESLSEHQLCLLRALALSPAGLPFRSVPELQDYFPTPAAECAELSRSLVAGGFVERDGDSVKIATRALAEVITTASDPGTLLQWHHRLYDLWRNSVPPEHPDRQRTLLYHDFCARAWNCGADVVEQTSRQMIDAGQIAAARQLLEPALEQNPPAAIRETIADLLAKIAFIEGRFEDSLRCLGPLIQEGQANATPATLDRLSRFAMLGERLGRPDQAEQILTKCREALPTGQSPGASAVFGTLAWIAFKRGDAETAGRLAEEGLVRVPLECRDAGHALLLNTVGTLAFYRGDVDAAALAWQRCLEVCEAVHDRKGIANMYNNLGVLAAQSGERLRARALWQKCAAIATEINDTHRLAGINNNLGIDALENGQLPEAEEHYLKSLALFRVMKSPREQVATLSNLGELSYYRADFGRALAYFQEAISLAATIDDSESQLEPLIYLGKLLCRLDELEQAAKILDKAKSIAQETGVKKGQAQVLEGLALLATRHGQFSEATGLLAQANLLMSDDADPLAQIHLHLTACAAAAAGDDGGAAKQELELARKSGEHKWDPFAAARTLVYGLLFANEHHDARELQRLTRQVAVYPDFLWQLHWAVARQLTAAGAAKRALEEYGRGVAVLKAITARLSEDHKRSFLNSPAVTCFKAEAVKLRKELRESV